MKILFITNGHGEDIIAARIIKELAGHDISVCPVVGAGQVFDGLPVTVLGPRKKMPSGGFVYQSLSNIIKDVFSGLIGNSIEHSGLLGLGTKLEGLEKQLPDHRRLLYGFVAHST